MPGGSESVPLACALGVVGTWYSGCASIFSCRARGDAEPAGRLPVTMPRADGELALAPSQYPGVAFADGLRAEYSERLEVGYRWYHARNATPAFAFGHGLSYTTFSYAWADTRAAASGVSGGAAPWSFAVAVTNSGDVAGDEVVQLYLTFPPSAAAR